jgi:hypothetical protein
MLDIRGRRRELRRDHDLLARLDELQVGRAQALALSVAKREVLTAVHLVDEAQPVGRVRPTTTTAVAPTSART